jgi:hypothetical protein
MMVQDIGMEWRVLRVGGGGASAVLSHGEEVVRLVDELAREWAG